MSTTVMNCFTWYWGVTVRDIWEAARKNELRDEREGAYNGAQLADQALSQIRTKHPATKVTTSSYSKPRHPRQPILLLLRRVVTLQAAMYREQLQAQLLLSRLSLQRRGMLHCYCGIWIIRCTGSNNASQIQR